MSPNEACRLAVFGQSNNSTDGALSIACSVMRSASLQRLRMRLRTTADLCSLVDASVPAYTPGTAASLRFIFRRVSVVYTMVIVFPCHLLPLRRTAVQTFRPERRWRCMRGG